MSHRVRRISRRLPLLLAGVLLVGLALAGPGAAQSPSPTAGQTALKVGWDIEPDNLNPFVGIQQSSFDLYHLEYDFLTDYGAAHLETEPGLATSWTHSANGLVWTFKIRSGVKWQDGVPLTAHDVAFTYTFIMKYKLQAFLSALSGIKTATALNDTTVVITCSRPKADILAMWVPILPQHIWGRFHSYEQAFNFANKPPIVGSGPFQVVQWVHGQYIRCVANKSYWGGAPKVDQLNFNLYTDPMTMASDLRSGAIQLAIDLPPAQVKGLQSVYGISAQACAQKAFDYLGFNCYTGPSGGNPVLRDWKFRNALNWAVDKQKLVDLAYNDYATPGSTLFEPNFYDPKLDWHWTPPASEAYSFDLQKASAMLTAAGYPLVNGVRLNKQGKPIVLRLWARTTRPEPGGRQAHHAVVPRSRPEDPVLGAERGDAHQRRLELRRQGLQARLRHVPLVLAAERLRPGAATRLLHHRPDPGQQRRLLVRRAVRPAVPAAVDHARPAAAQADRLADGADLLRPDALYRARLSQAARGLEHGIVDRLGAYPDTRRRRRLHQRQRRQLPPGRPEAA